MADTFINNLDIFGQLNIKHILQVIRQYAPISRAEIVQKTDFTAATVSRIVAKLLKTGLVIENGYGESQGGRRPVLLELKPTAILSIGIDIEIDEIIGVIIDLNGNVLHKEQAPNQRNVDQEKIVILVNKILDSLLNTLDYKRKIVGIGIGIHGIVDYIKGISLFPPAFNWEALPLASIVSKEYNLPVILENNDRALALGENWFGAARNLDNFISLKIGSGIGSGIFTNGQLYRGASNSAGEIGHIMVDENGPLCSCGNYGCLESMASISAIINRTKKMMKQGADSLLFEMSEGKIETIDEEIIFQAAQLDDKVACQILADTGRYLGIGIASLVNILNPEAVILSGKITAGFNYILDDLQEILKNRALRYPAEYVNILPSQLNKEGVAIGAAVLIIKSIFSLKQKLTLEID